MSKSAMIGELRIPIIIKARATTTDPDGYDVNVWANVFGDGKTVRCKWVNVYGEEATTARQLGLCEPATLTMRYSPLITSTCIIYRGSDQPLPDKPEEKPIPFEVISLDDVEQRHVWLEVKVQRMVKAV